MITLERQEHEESPRMNTHGHLALLDLEHTSQEELTMTTSTMHTDPVQRTAFDRIFDKGLLLLILATVGAVAACLAHL